LRRVSQRRRTGDCAHALRAAEELVSRRGRAEDYAAQGYCLRTMGRLAEAVICLIKNHHPQSADAQAHMIRSSVLNKLGRHQDALASCDKAIELNPREAARGATAAASC